jgi:hypothetical protein
MHTQVYTCIHKGYTGICRYTLGYTQVYTRVYAGRHKVYADIHKGYIGIHKGYTSIRRYTQGV